MTIGKYLKQKRKEAKLSQGHVGYEMGYCTSQFISNIERDIALPPLKSIKDYCEILLMSKKDRNELEDMFLKEMRRQVREAFK